MEVTIRNIGRETFVFPSDASKKAALLPNSKRKK
jgi:hypothetical protein